MNNPVFQELVSEDDYFDFRSDERMYLDLRASSGYVKEAEKIGKEQLKNKSARYDKRDSN